MRVWQLVLEEFAQMQEPRSWEAPQVLRSTKSERFDAVMFLLEKGFLRQAGQRNNERTEPLYEISATGKFVVAAGITKLNRRKTDGKRKPEQEKSLAARMVDKSPISVFDLWRVPFRWNKKAELDL